MVLQAVWEPSHKADRLDCQGSYERSGVAFSRLAKPHWENNVLLVFKCLVDPELTDSFRFLT